MRRRAGAGEGRRAGGLASVLGARFPRPRAPPGWGVAQCSGRSPRGLAAAARAARGMGGAGLAGPCQQPLEAAVARTGPCALVGEGTSRRFGVMPGSCRLPGQAPGDRSLLLASRSASRRRGVGAGRCGCLRALWPHCVCCCWRVLGRHSACGERGAGRLCACRPQLLPRWCAGAAPAEEEERAKGPVPSHKVIHD